MYVLVGSGALCAFCIRALQQAEMPPPPVPLTFFIPESTGALTPASSGRSWSGAGAVATGAADGRGGGGSSFLQPVTSTVAAMSETAEMPREVLTIIAG